MYFIIINSVKNSFEIEPVSRKCNIVLVSIKDIANYNNALNRFLGNIDLDCELFTCTNCNCSLDTHKRSIDKLCNFIIHSCISASKKCIPMGATGARMERSGKT